MHDSVNDRAFAQLKSGALDSLNVRLSGSLTDRNLSIDFSASGTDGGIVLAGLTLGFQATIELINQPLDGKPHQWIRTTVPNAFDTLWMQMAGTFVTPGGKWRGCASGPFRAAARKEKLFQLRQDQPECAKTWVVVLETNRQPDTPVFDFIRAQATAHHPEQVVICYAPVESLAGATQVAARCPECLFHTWHHHKWPFVPASTWGLAPIAPVLPSESEMMTRTNEAILEAGFVHVETNGLSAEQRDEYAPLLTFSGLFPDTSFRALFNQAGGDFSKLPPLCFAPSHCRVSGADGTTVAGKPHEERLSTAWGL